MATKPNNERLAVMIDADNAQASLVHELMSEVSRYGTATIKRAYGDWTTPNLQQWKNVLHANAIQPMQQFRYTTGKNATDSALIIDAMDVLHAGLVDGFCLVSSDSDFTRLATRIREAGLAVYGFGERHTPEPFVAACDKFIYTEILKQKPVETPEAEPSAEPTTELAELQPLVIAAIDANAREDGWAPLGGVGSYIGKIDPSFDARNFGFKKLSDLVRALGYVETKDVPFSRPDGVVLNNMQIRMKRVVR
ncbi:NYN domain-containing protein [Hydrogenophaga sp. PAMC20947]|nr:NYN domain-containing protein [Hydrogenophaga sp. PAMC20947]